jgi:hypothetical protein
MRRDGAKHKSPNAGRPEAAMAGALGARIGGTNFYDGERHDGQYLGDVHNRLDDQALRNALRLTGCVSILKAKSIHGRYQQLPSKLDALPWPKMNSAQSLLALMLSPVKSLRARYAVSGYMSFLLPQTFCWPNCLAVRAEIYKVGWNQSGF